MLFLSINIVVAYYVQYLWICILLSRWTYRAAVEYIHYKPRKGTGSVLQLLADVTIKTLMKIKKYIIQ
jgi:hypothetical protein